MTSDLLMEIWMVVVSFACGLVMGAAAERTKRRDPPQIRVELQVDGKTVAEAMVPSTGEWAGGLK